MPDAKTLVDLARIADPSAMVRVTTDDAGVHWASRRLFERHLADRAALGSPPALVVDCTRRLRRARLTESPITCGACWARWHVHLAHDVTMTLLPERVASLRPLG